METLLFTATPFDRAAALRRDSAAMEYWRHPARALVSVHWHGVSLLRHGRALLAEGEEGQSLLGRADEVVFLGLMGERAAFAADLSSLPAGADGLPPVRQPGDQWGELRAVGSNLSPEESCLLATGRALLNWHRSARFCGHCGAATQVREGGHVRACTNPACAVLHYPRTDNAVIMRVTGAERILLHRQPAWPAGMWSVLAGFVEPGETLEHAVAREVQEETGILVADIAYGGSQPWPFPASLMVGYTARAVGGELRPDPHELEDARWFSRADIAAQFDDAHRGGDGGCFLARPGSIARKLIDDWL